MYGGYPRRVSDAGVEEITLRLSAASLAAAVAGPVLLALGARAELRLQALDELAAAVELVVGAALPGQVTIRARRDGGRLAVSVTPIDPGRLRSRRPLLAGLAPEVVVEGPAADLIVDA